MSTGRRKLRLRLNTVTVNLGCSSCRKPKLSDIFNQLKPKSKTTTATINTHRKNNHAYRSSSSYNNYYDYDTTTATATATTSAATFSPVQYSDDTESETKSFSRTVKGFGRTGAESVAVEKDSDDPYLDFRHSMLQMILENEIYSKEDLRELLDCFLQLNSPYHHGIIVRAFTEIWNSVFSVKYASSRKTAVGRKSRDL